jgi:hypothetical protein
MNQLKINISNYYAQAWEQSSFKKFFQKVLARADEGVIIPPFFDSSLDGFAISRSQRRKPREIRGRLRHCDGLQSSRATGSPKRNREGGSEV